MEEIESADASTIIDSDSAELVAEMNAKRRKWRLWPWILCLGTAGVITISSRWPSLPEWADVALLILVLLLTFGAMLFDRIRKTTVLMYEFEAGTEKGFEQMHAAFDALAACARTWHIASEGRVRDRKYHAGASSVVNRKSIAVGRRSPPFVKTNVSVPYIPVGKQTLYFFPDLLLVFEPNAVGAVSYAKLCIEVAHTRFIEDGGVPRDAKIVDRTWRYVNKSGGPDRRFKDNKELPIALYEEVTFSSDTGLNEVVQLSRTGASESIIAAVRALAGVSSRASVQQAQCGN